MEYNPGIFLYWLSVLVLFKKAFVKSFIALVSTSFTSIHHSYNYDESG
jgi:hypothetical protein